MMAKAGRPSSYDPKVAEKICERLAKDESLASICSDEGMPSTTSVYRWKASNEQFRADYVRAREDQGHTVADTVGDIRRQLLAGAIDAATATAAGNLAKWEAGKRASRDFGDRLDLTTGGEAIKMDETAVAARAAALLKMGLDRADGSD